MQLVWVAAFVSFFVSAVSANETGKQEILQKSREFIDNFYKDITNELKKLKAEGKSYSAKDVNTITADITMNQFSKRTAERERLLRMVDNLKQTGERKGFNIYEQVSPEAKAELDQAVSDLIRKDDVTTRSVGAAATGADQVLSDLIRTLLTRYEVSHIGPL